MSDHSGSRISSSGGMGSCDGVGDAEFRGIAQNCAGYAINLMAQYNYKLYMVLRRWPPPPPPLPAFQPAQHSMTHTHVYSDSFIC